jgi:L-fuconolactonase
MKIDSHQHFWQYNPSDYVWMSEEHNVIRRNFLPEDLRPLLDACGIDGTIAVQARQMLAENDFLLELSCQNPLIMGVVGWIPLCDPNVDNYLAHYALHHKIVGFRHVLHDEPDDDFMLRKDFNEGIKALSRYNLCYDVLIFEKHLPQTLQFVDQHPGLTVIVDHIAKPRIQEGDFDFRWEKNIRQLAEREHVNCKLSGMVTEVSGGKWDFALLKPYFEVVLEAFGPDRLMFGSDWPVCLLQSEYHQWLETVINFIGKLSESEKSAIMGGNAARIYLKH